MALETLLFTLRVVLQDFEWDQCQSLTVKDTRKSNEELMQKHAEESFTKRMLADSAPGSEGREPPG